MVVVIIITDTPLDQRKGETMNERGRFAIGPKVGYFVVNSDSAALDWVLKNRNAWVAPSIGFQGVGGSAAHG
jgi:hypothetical protein